MGRQLEKGQHKGPRHALQGRRELQLRSRPRQADEVLPRRHCRLGHQRRQPDPHPCYCVQLMREHLLRILTRLGGGQKVKDADLIAWADKVTGSGKSTSMNDFRDSSLSNSLFFLDLIDAIRPGTVEAEYVTAGGSDEEKLDNARYAVALARRIGALIFLLPEDIVEVKPKLILTLVATLMALDRGN